MRAAHSARMLCLLLLGGSLAPHVAAADVARLSNPGHPPTADAAALAGAAEAPQSAPVRGPKRADFRQENASADARHVADWVVDAGDNLGLPFVIVDKSQARVFVFNAGGQLGGAAPALLGLARGDDSAPGIGDRELSRIPPEQRTTPAGRFVAALGRNFGDKDILWVDYDNAISLHRVITTNPRDHRLERLASESPLDNRISYGCINVPQKFYDNVVKPAFTGTDGIVYVLPETRPARAVFMSYDVEEHWRPRTVGQAALPQPGGRSAERAR